MLVDKLLFLFFGSFLCSTPNSISSNEELGTEKAYKVTCDSSNSKYGTCIYSAKFESSGGNLCTGLARITINGEGEPFSVNTLSPLILNIEVYKGDEVVLFFQPANRNNCKYGFYNQPNGNGVVLVDSRLTSFVLYNPCTSICDYNLTRTSGSNWGQNTFITITVNNETPEIFNGTSIVFTANKGDLIQFQFTTVQGTGGQAVKIDDIISSDTIFEWAQSGYFSPMTFINPCEKIPLPPSPFGGNLTQTTEEEADNSLEDLSSPLLWFPITFNENQD